MFVTTSSERHHDYPVFDLNSQYVRWARLPNKDAFWGSSAAQTLYQAHIRQVMRPWKPNRVSIDQR